MMAEMKYMIEKMAELQANIASFKGGALASSVRPSQLEPAVDAVTKDEEPQEPSDNHHKRDREHT